MSRRDKRCECSQCRSNRKTSECYKAEPRHEPEPRYGPDPCHNCRCSPCCCRPAPKPKLPPPCCCPGPVGPQGRHGRDGRDGDDGDDGVLNSEFDSLRERREIPVGVFNPMLPLPTGTILAQVTAGDATSPPRFLQIFTTFSGAQRLGPTPPNPPVVPASILFLTVAAHADFYIEVERNGVVTQFVEGAELSFVVQNEGQSGALNLRVPVGPGPAIVRLRATANVPGIAIDVPSRPHRDNATLLVLETLA